MALSGLDVYRLLPKTNCRDCGVPTCLAFAMQIASGKAKPEMCPHLSAEAKERLTLAYQPPTRVLEAGPPAGEVRMGGQTVLYRHEKKFINPTAVFVDVGELHESFSSKVEAVKTTLFERVGQQYTLDGFSVRVRSADDARFALAVSKNIGLAAMLIVDRPDALVGFQAELRATKPIIAFARECDPAECAQAFRATGAIVALGAKDHDAAARIAAEFGKTDFHNLLVRYESKDFAQRLALMMSAQQKSIRRGRREFGYPLLAEIAPGPAAVLNACSAIARHASIIVVPPFEPRQMMALLTFRHDLYSDPERPVQVQSKLYEIGEANANSPLYITTNFSLTYYSVENEVTASRVPAYILPVDTDGTSVLTAWAADKFDAEKIALSMQRNHADDVCPRKLAVLPGHVGQMNKKLRELTGWEVVAGPYEASGIPAFARGLYDGERDG